MIDSKMQKAKIRDIGFVNCIRTNGKTVGHFEGEILIAVRN